MPKFRKYKHKCFYCTKSFNRPVKLREHIENNHTGNNKKYACDMCSKKYISSDTLQKHQKSHQSAPYPCFICKIYFDNEQKQKKHNSLYHNPNKNLSCNLCDKKYSDPSSLRRHYKKTHANERASKNNGGIVSSSHNQNAHENTSQHQSLKLAGSVQLSTSSTKKIINEIASEDNSQDKSLEWLNDIQYGEFFTEELTINEGANPFQSSNLLDYT